MYLAGDIGGTKTILALFDQASGPHHPLFEQIFPSAQYPSLTAIVAEFLAQHPAPIAGAAFGVAGPVVAGRASITNLTWTIDAGELSAALGGAPVRLLNDLEAIAQAVPILEATDLATLTAGAPVAGGAIGVIAPGTGLGEAFLTWDGTRYRPHPSEGGHTTFAPRNQIEKDLLDYLHQRFSHVSYERVCSGIGIPNLYAFTRDRLLQRETPAVAEQLAAVADPTPVIVQAGMATENMCLVCRTTLELFVDILAAEAGNLALKVLATGGIYIGGGLPPRVLPLIRRERFLHIFRDKGRFSELLAQVPIHVILEPKAGLLGAAAAAMA
ncbi:glucokinase [Chloroflexus sp.]|uniref:glucokinase n=1 Tax=Chloroflexus sp. TaxID=1904827 RepID=UPI002610A597|nr:glucokinase [uncultured Chloroflexus sp.]